MFSILALGLYQILGVMWTAIIVGSLGVFLLYGKWLDGYFRRRGVQSTPARIPFFGHMIKVCLQMEHITTMSKKIYNAFPKERYIGLWQFTQPTVMITDLELIKQITIKDFDSFQDHLGVIDEKVDPLFGNNLIALKGQKWRDMRATLSPAFTSSKMKGMFESVVDCGEEVTTYLQKELQKPENESRGYFEIEMKDIFTRYTNDVIATAAFGIKINSLKNRDNEFYVMGKQATDFTGFALIKMFIIMLIPRIMKALHFTVLSSSVSAFFRNLVSSTMKIREEQHILRPDLIQLLMQAKKGSIEGEEKDENKDSGFATVEESSIGKQTVNRKWTDDELVAQAVVFFLGGFDTSSNLLCFVAHELAINPDVQKKLQDEIDEVVAKNSGKLSYTDLHSMKYMDMVISETLRLWPPGVALERKCVKTYTLPPPNESSAVGLTLNHGDGIFIPLNDIHHDPKYYDNPEKFDPERFSEENKGSINPLAYLPFGIGPRNCIGSRFALMEAKSVVFQLLRNFNLVATSKTSNPIKIKKAAFNFTAQNGFWVGVEPRGVK